ncbi:helix-turn-helix domain-containing protein [Agromyces sp. MMS24-K17]|uniref:helix-turn-helix domain-containing protein n=1 Tax=Agromyces sp. MMS24-K17 TaxID=3372850 RepID=UPI00375523C2
MTSAGELLRAARTRAGLTQTEFAHRAGLTQSVVSAYERGRREPSFATLQRLVGATGHELAVELVPITAPSMLGQVRANGPRLRAELGALGAVDVRVFGSVARGDETDASDVDLLVELGPDVGAFALLRMQSTAEEILGRPVDVVPRSGLKPDVIERVLAEAVPV